MRRSAITMAMLLAGALGCSDQPAATEPTEVPAAAVHPHTTTVDGLLKAVRGATARYNSTAQALEAGYQPDTHCVPGMGYHWLNASLVDPVFDPLNPEVVIYAHDANGRLRVVAVEYVVIDAGQPQPDFAGRAFDVGGTPVPLPHWSQHVWLYEANADGVLTNFNPAIACGSSPR